MCATAELVLCCCCCCNSSARCRMLLSMCSTNLACDIPCCINQMCYWTSTKASSRDGRAGKHPHGVVVVVVVVVVCCCNSGDVAVNVLLAYIIMHLFHIKGNMLYCQLNETSTNASSSRRESVCVRERERAKREREKRERRGEEREERERQKGERERRDERKQTSTFAPSSCCLFQLDC